MNDPIQDYGAPFIRRINLTPVQPNGSTPPMMNSLVTNAASRLSTNGARTFGERDDLLNDVNNTFYGGGQAPVPTPTPTPVPRFLPRANVTKDDLETYGAGSQYGFTSPTPRYY